MSPRQQARAADSEGVLSRFQQELDEVKKKILEQEAKLENLPDFSVDENPAIANERARIRKLIVTYITDERSLESRLEKLSSQPAGMCWFGTDAINSIFPLFVSDS